jgi:hypothetical protein
MEYFQECDHSLLGEFIHVQVFPHVVFQVDYDDVDEGL